MTKKPDRGRIINWSFLSMGRRSREICVIGDFLDHEWIREGGRTSPVIKYDAKTGRIETNNSCYTLVDKGEPSPLKEWPNPGDKLKFLDANGFEWELDHARAVFDVNQVYTVLRCDISAFNHYIYFEGIEGKWNGVMFESVK